MQSGWFGRPCALAQAPLTDAVAQEFDLDHQRELARRSFSAPFRWDFDSTPTTPPTPRPTGYLTHTTIEASLSFGDPVYLDHVPLTSALQECRREIDLPAVISLSTADGAIAPTQLTGTLRLIEGSLPGAWSLLATADLAGISGRLDLKLDPLAPKRGALTVQVVPSPQGLRGQLWPFVITFPDLETARAYDPRSDLISGQLTRAPLGRWPDDECSYDQFPIEPAAPQPWLDGASFNETLATLPLLAAARPQVARWFGGPDVDVTVELGKLARVCMGTHIGDLSFVLDTAAQVRTSDGRVHTRIPSATLRLARAAPGRNTLDLMLQIPMLAPARFKAQAGIEGIDPVGSPWLSGQVGASFAWDAGGVVESIGSVEVWGAPPCGAPGVHCGDQYTPDLGSGLGCLFWPPPESFQEFCGRHRR